MSLVRGARRLSRYFAEHSLRHIRRSWVTVVVKAQSVAASSVSLPFGIRAERSRDRVRVGHVCR